MKKTVPIKKNVEFIRAYRRGKFFAGRFIVLYILKNRLDTKRLGITASKKVGNSVRRNRIKRLIKENYRAYEEFIQEGYDFIFVARSNENIPDSEDIKKEMKFLLKKLNVYNREK